MYHHSVPSNNYRKKFGAVIASFEEAHKIVRTPREGGIHAADMMAGGRPKAHPLYYAYPNRKQDARHQRMIEELQAQMARQTFQGRQARVLHELAMRPPFAGHTPNGNAYTFPGGSAYRNGLARFQRHQ